MTRIVFSVAAGLGLLFFPLLTGCGAKPPTIIKKATKAPAAAAPASTLPPVLVKACAQAKKEQKVVLFQLYDSECNFCLDMDETLADAKVKKKLTEFIFCRIDIQEDHDGPKGIIDEYLLTHTPTFIGYKGDGTALDDDYFIGFRSAATFCQELENIQLMAQGKETKDVPLDEHPNFGKG